MKQLINYLGVGALFLTGCTAKRFDTKISEEVSILIDATDSFKLTPDSTLFSYFSLDEHVENGAKYRIGIIADRLYTEAREYELADAVTTEAQNSSDDVLHRQKCILKFYHKFSTDIQEMQWRTSQECTLPYSLCFQQIARELTKLAKSDADHRTLVVFSDLLEKSDIYDCYSPSSRRLLHCCTDSVISRFEKSYSLPEDLHGIFLHIFYCPKSRQDDAMFRSMIGIYSNMIEKRGGKITIQTNNRNVILHPTKTM